MGEALGIFTELEREARFEKELARLRKALAELNPDNAKLLDGLVNDAAFMAVTLEEARLMIRRDGIIEEYQNGANQCGRKKSSAVEVYDKMVNTQMKLVKQICEGMSQSAGSAAEDIMQFALGGKK